MTHASRIVIAGGGVAGHRIAFALQREAQVTLIDPKDFFEIPMAVPRLLVEPRRAAEAVVPYADFLPAVHRVQGRLQAVGERTVEVLTEAGQGIEVPFDFLVLATGSGYPDDTLKAQQGTASARRAHFHRLAAKIRDAGSIAIVGGGPVGVEIAAEILEEYPGRKLMLFQGAATLLPSITPGPQRYALEHMRKRGADVRFNQAVGRHDPPESDVLLWCIGYKAEPSYLGARAIPVDAHLRVEGRLNVFAVGDITALPEPKLGIQAGKHAAVAIENLRRLMRNPHARLATYRPATGSRTMLVTLGRRHGTGHLPIGDFTNSWFARKVKSGDMFIGRYRNGIGLKRTLPAPANAFA